MRRSSRSTSHRPPRTRLPTCSMGASWNSCRIRTRHTVEAGHTAGEHVPLAAVAHDLLLYWCLLLPVSLSSTQVHCAHV